MSRPAATLRWSVVLGTVFVLSACAQPSTGSVAANPPPVPPGASATWYHIGFATNSSTIGTDAQPTVSTIAAYMDAHPGSVATIIGRTDTVGTGDYNMHLSHHRADAVRDALVYAGHVPADRVETRWTGETRPRVVTGDDVAFAANRVVDVAIH